MWFDILISFFAVVILGILITLWKTMLLVPLKFGKNTELSVLLKVCGKEPELEQLLKGLEWIVDSSSPKAEIIIEISDADEDTRYIASEYAKRYSYITVTE